MALILYRITLLVFSDRASSGARSIRRTVRVHAPLEEEREEVKGGEIGR